MQNSQSKRLYTTHEVAKLLGVTPITVIRWIEGGKFRCYTTVGGHRRIEHDELVQFAQAYNLPWQGEEELRQRHEFVVLAVDDEETLLELLTDMLGAIPGMRIITATNGFSAGAKLVEQRPDMVLLDFLMPELDGFEFAQFCREDPRFRTIPIVAMTGLRNEADHVKIKSAGVNEILLKPFTLEKLTEIIERYRRLKGDLPSLGKNSA